MIEYKYSYLISTLILLSVWIFLFFYRKDNRKELLFLSLLFAIIGTPLEYIYVQDWWKPTTITNTIIGIEDFLFSFTIAGIAAVIYEDIFKKKIKTRNNKKIKELLKSKNFYLVGILPIVIFCVLFIVFNVNSIVSSIVSLSIGTIFILYKRKDLILDSLLSGILVMLISFFLFLIMELISPNWVTQVWILENLSGYFIANAPIEDLIWFFLAGTYIGPLYEFWQESQLIDKK